MKELALIINTVALIGLVVLFACSIVNYNIPREVTGLCVVIGGYVFLNTRAILQEDKPQKPKIP